MHETDFTPARSAPPASAIRLEMKLEVHRPGLDLDPKRWNYHTIFMAEIHANVGRVAVQAYEGFLREGRGGLFVDAAQWLRVVKHQFSAASDGLPISYLPAEALAARVDFGSLQTGVEALLRTYDPAEGFVLVVYHHPGDTLSCYVASLVPGPEALYRSL